VVATANVLRDLRSADARAALDGILEHQPDLIGLQEWGPKRIGLLRAHGRVALLPDLGLRLGRRRSLGNPGDYLWATALLGGCAVGVRAERYDVLGLRLVLLSRPGHADKPDRPFGLEPPRLAAMARLRDRITGRTVVFVDYHLVPGVQREGDYWVDRPRLVARHRAEAGRLESLTAREQAQGHVVIAVGDANFSGLRLAGLTSAWDGCTDLPATLDDGRTVDDVFGPGRPVDVQLLHNPSDHRAVIATRLD
jgi:hypothetical protein